MRLDDRTVRALARAHEQTRRAARGGDPDEIREAEDHLLAIIDPVARRCRIHAAARGSCRD